MLDYNVGMKQRSLNAQGGGIIFMIIWNAIVIGIGSFFFSSVFSEGVEGIFDLIMPIAIIGIMAFFGIFALISMIKSKFLIKDIIKNGKRSTGKVLTLGQTSSNNNGTILCFSYKDEYGEEAIMQIQVPITDYALLVGKQSIPIKVKGKYAMYDLAPIKMGFTDDVHVDNFSIDPKEFEYDGGFHYCPYCGSPIGEKDKFCPSCGGKIDNHDK